MSSKLSLYSDDGQDFCADYDLKDKLGEGVFSDVWLCVHRRNEKKFAAKILKKRYEWTSNTVQWNTISEVMVASSLEKHPFLLTMEAVYHIIECGKIILITELMEKSLYDVIEESQCPVPDSRIKSYMYQMLEGTYFLTFSVDKMIKKKNSCCNNFNNIITAGRLKIRFKVLARERLHSQGHKTREHSVDIQRQAVENRRFRDRRQHHGQSSVHGICGHPVVPSTRMCVDARMVRH